MLNGITIVSFTAGYAVALCLEISRLFFGVSLRAAIIVILALAGLVAHSIYLIREAQQGFTQGAPLFSWYHGCLIVAWLLAVAYVTLSLWKKPTAIGLFFLPTILALVAIAHIFPRQPQFTSEAVNRVWSLVHGVALLLGTSAVMVGFLGGVLYLAQSYRLKQKIVTSRGLRLPSLEILQRVSEGALIASCCLLLLGLISGILLNLQPGEASVVPWTDPVVWTSGVLLLWLLAALSFNAVYKPARQGRKVAYLTMASFIFLGLVLAILLLDPSSHGASSGTQEADCSRRGEQRYAA
jgi:ABC-type uncharacterized transport system permease subunit